MKKAFLLATLLFVAALVRIGMAAPVKTNDWPQVCSGVTISGGTASCTLSFQSPAPIPGQLFIVEMWATDTSNNALSLNSTGSGFTLLNAAAASTGCNTRAVIAWQAYSTSYSGGTLTVTVNGTNTDTVHFVGQVLEFGGYAASPIDVSSMGTSCSGAVPANITPTVTHDTLLVWAFGDNTANNMAMVQTDSATNPQHLRAFQGGYCNTACGSFKSGGTAMYTDYNSVAAYSWAANITLGTGSGNITAGTIAIKAGNLGVVPGPASICSNGMVGKSYAPYTIGQFCKQRYGLETFSELIPV